MPAGGQALPISTAGAKLLWKKAQKNEKKNRTSDAINKIIPHRSPTPTDEVCKPWYVPSRTTSRHHWPITINVKKEPKTSKSTLKVWNHFAIPDTRLITLKALKSGHGLLSTR